MNRFAVRIAVTVVLMFVCAILAAPLWAKSRQTRRSAEKPEIIAAYLTFHNASPGRKTCNGKRQTAEMAAINRNKHHRLMDKRIIPFAYRDKKTGRKVFLKLDKRKISDVMGPVPRSESRYHIDYYLAGSVPARYDKYNNTIWYFKVVG